MDTPSLRNQEDSPEHSGRSPCGCLSLPALGIHVSIKVCKRHLFQHPVNTQSTPSLLQPRNLTHHVPRLPLFKQVSRAWSSGRLAPLAPLASRPKHPPCIGLPVHEDRLGLSIKERPLFLSDSSSVSVYEGGNASRVSF